MRDRKGFVTSLVAGGLILLLIILISLLHNSYLESERAIKIFQPVVYSKFFFDDAFREVNNIVGPDFSINKENGSLVITISDTSPKQNFSHDLEDYESYLENSFANLNHANISADFSLIKNGTVELVLSNLYLYNHSYVGDNKISLSTLGENDNTNITHYEINLTINRYREKIEMFSWDQKGDLNISLKVSDKNGTWESNGLIDSAQIHKLTITYSSNESRFVEVLIGKIGERKGALMMIDHNSGMAFRLLARTPIRDPDLPNSYYYNAYLEYKQTGIIKRGQIGNG